MAVTIEDLVILLLYFQTRSARFMVGTWPKNKEGRQLDKIIWGSDDILDRQMDQIPGFDNYNQFIPDDSFGVVTVGVNGSLLNSAYYHGRYKVNKVTISTTEMQWK